MTSIIRNRTIVAATCVASVAFAGVSSASAQATANHTAAGVPSPPAALVHGAGSQSRASKTAHSPRPSRPRQHRSLAKDVIVIGGPLRISFTRSNGCTAPMRQSWGWSSTCSVDAFNEIGYIAYSDTQYFYWTGTRWLQYATRRCFTNGGCQYV
jgi:hypothetical protein